MKVEGRVLKSDFSMISVWCSVFEVWKGCFNFH